MILLNYFIKSEYKGKLSLALESIKNKINSEEFQEIIEEIVEKDTILKKIVFIDKNMNEKYYKAYDKRYRQLHKKMAWETDINSIIIEKSFLNLLMIICMMMD